MESPYLEILNQKPEHPVLEEIRSLASALKIPIIQKDGLQLIRQFLLASGARKVLELGSAIGYFAIFTALYANVDVTSVEVDPQLLAAAAKFAKKAGVGNKIDFMNADALSLDAGIFRDYDLLFIDAAKSQYQKYFTMYSGSVRTGGIIVSDNLLFRGHVEHPETIISRNRRQLVNKIRQYNTWLKEQPGFLTYFYEIGDGIAISIKE